MASKLLLGRRRREIATRKEVFLDLLSWRYVTATTRRPVDKPIFVPFVPPQLRERSETNGDLAWVGGDRRTEFKTLMKRLDGRLGSRILGEAHHLCEKFDTGFDPSLTSRDPDRIPGTGKADEDRFLNSLADYLCRGGYHLVSEEEWKYAKDNSYGFSIPTRVRWSTLDGKLVQNVANKLYLDPAWATSGNNAKGKVKMPKEANYALVFHRGVGMDRTTRLFFGEKMDEVIRRTALIMYQIFHAQFLKFSRAVGRKIRELQRSSIERTTEVVRPLGENALSHIPQQVLTQLGKVSRAAHRGTLGVLDRMLRLRISQLSAPEHKKVDVAVQLPSEPTEQTSVANSHAANTERVNAQHPAATDVDHVANPVTGMQRQSSSTATVKDVALDQAVAARITLAEKAFTPWNLLTYVTLQEVTYKDMVVIYREAKPNAPKVIGVDTALSFRRNDRDLLPQYANKTNIHIRQYRDVPMSDIELLFPEKQVYMSVMDRLRFGLMSAIGVAVMVPVLADDFSASPAWVAGVVASSSYLVRVLSRMYMSWAYYSSLTNAFFFDNVVASGTASIGSIGLDALDQATKEAAVVYLALVELQQDNPNVPSTMDDIILQCKNVFEQKYPHNMHMFDPKPALRDLEDLGLVKGNSATGRHSPELFTLIMKEDLLLSSEKISSDDRHNVDSLELLHPDYVPTPPSPAAPIATRKAQ